jgi:alkylhydroperoxidase family enzyme
VEGGDPALVDALEQGGWQNANGLGERDRMLCVLADKLSRTPTRMVESDWDALRAAGLDDTGCLEIAHIVGIFNHLTRLADGLGLVLDTGTRRAAETGIVLHRADE